jgi:hypothetical protein
MAPLVGVIGSLQALEAIKVLTHYGVPAAGKIVMYDAMTCQFREMKLMRNPQCEVCGGKQKGNVSCLLAPPRLTMRLATTLAPALPVARTRRLRRHPGNKLMRNLQPRAHSP